MRRPHTLLLTGLLAMSLLVTGCNATSETVATVNNTEITKAEYDQAYKDFAQSMGIPDPKNLPVEESQKDLVRDYLKTMTINKLIVQTLIKEQASKQGIGVTDEDVAKFKDEMFKRPGMKEQFQEYLKKNNLTEADFDRSIRETLLVDKFVEKNAAADLNVTNDDIQKMYSSHQAELKLPERVKAKQILVEANVPKMKKEIRAAKPNISDADLQKELEAKLAPTQQEVDDILSQVKANPGKFAEVAKEKSDDKVSAANGGDLGYVANSPEVDPDLWQGLDSAPVGKPSVVKTLRGYHIVLVQEHLPPKTQSLAESRELLKRVILDQKKQGWLQEWLTKEKEKATIDISDKYKPKQPGADQALPAPGAPGPGAAPGGMPQTAPPHQ